MNTITKNEFSSIIKYFYLKQNLFFYIKDQKIIENVEIECYYKKIEKFKRKLLSQFYYLFLKLESITGNLPLFKTMSIKILKKKKIQRRGYYIIKSSVDDNICSFIDFYIINNSYRNIYLLKRTKKKYRYLQQLSKRKFISKLLLNKTFIKLKMEYNFCNLCFKRVKKVKRYFRRFKKRRFKRSLKLLIKIDSKFKSYYFNLLSVVSINNYKILLFIYKYFRKKIKK